MEKAVSKIRNEYHNRKDRQLAVATWVSRLSPVSSYVYAVTELCGTGISEAANVKEHARNYDQRLKQELYSLWDFKEYMLRGGSGSGGYYDKEGVDKKVLDQARETVPHFTNYRPIPLKERIGNITTDAILLFLFAILFFCMAYAKFIGYDLT